MQKSVKIALVAVAVVILGGAFGFWWFVLRDDAPKRAALATQSSSDANCAANGARADGTWTVASGDNVFVGYRIQELFGGETIKKTAVGRTPAVTGTMTMAGDQVTTTDITADMTQLKSDQSRRDSAIRTQALETQKFTTATFKLTKPIVLPATLQPCQPIDITATGDLTLHGQTKSVDIPLKATWNGDSIEVAGGAPIVPTDYGIDPPNISFVSVDDNGEFEMQLTFTHS